MSQHSRREFLKRAGALSVAAQAAPWALQLAAMNEAAAQSAPADYKAIVCFFFYGGNDCANTVIPYDSDHYDFYQSVRPSFATAKTAIDAAGTLLTPLTALANGRQYGLGPQLASLMPIFSAKRLAVLLNVGPLIQPTTKAQYQAKSVPLPAKLFSHNDQQSIWQSDLPEGATSGWGGRMADLFLAGNTSSTFTAISVSGNSVFMSGKSAVQYQISTTGAVAVNPIKNASLYGSAAGAAALKQLITASRTNLFESEYNRVTARSIGAYDQMTAALAGAPATTTTFPTSNIGSQFKMVARMISARASLGAKRQVFFVSLGGFDLHDGMATQHPGLLTSINDALAAFDAELGVLGVQNQVTTFTASDFGRTQTGNNDGSDHGWGSHHFIMGGAVQGGQIYGTPPQLVTNAAKGLTPDHDVGQGRMLPTTSVDQFAATLANWYGVSATDQLSIFPSLANYSTRNLGFV